MKTLSIFLFVFALLLLVFYLTDFPKTVQYTNKEPADSSHRYLINTVKCKILDLEPFDSQVKPYHRKLKYVPCTNQEMLTYVTKNSNVVTLHLNTTALQRYQQKNITCYYHEVFRDVQTENPDDSIRMSEKKYFKDNITVGSRPIVVHCETPGEVIYENVHAPVIITQEVRKKLERVEAKDFYNVLLIGIDSVSRLNFIRSLPNSYKFLKEKGWISFEGYNKVDDNTYPNVMALLTGSTQRPDSGQCNAQEPTGLNNCSMLWYDFSDKGYVTAYAEDEAHMGTFNLFKRGFLHPPTDYYYRPYFLASESLKTIKYGGLSYCTGPENTGERIISVAKDFTNTFSDRPHFGLFWMNSFSHNNLNMVSMMDDKIRRFLEDISSDRTFVLFLSDHGLRCTDFRLSSMGWLEERLPFLFVWIPEKFRRQFPEFYASVKSNCHKLTTPYDLYVTLQHLLVLSGFKYTIKQSRDCPKCRSLFMDMEDERSCTDAGIGRHWCTCIDYRSVESNTDFVRRAAGVVIGEIHRLVDLLQGKSVCARFLLERVISVRMSENTLVVIVETRPKAIFEATLFFYRRNGTTAFRVDGISRIDLYQKNVWCILGSVQKYCYCK